MVIEFFESIFKTAVSVDCRHLYAD